MFVYANEETPLSMPLFLTNSPEISDRCSEIPPVCAPLQAFVDSIQLSTVMTTFNLAFEVRDGVLEVLDTGVDAGNGGCRGQ